MKILTTNTKTTSMPQNCGQKYRSIHGVFPGHNNWKPFASLRHPTSQRQRRPILLAFGRNFNLEIAQIGRQRARRLVTIHEARGLDLANSMNLVWGC